MKVLVLQHSRQWGEKKVHKTILGGLWFRGALQTASDLTMVLHSEELTCEFTEFMRAA